MKKSINSNHSLWIFWTFRQLQLLDDEKKREKLG